MEKETEKEGIRRRRRRNSSQRYLEELGGGGVSEKGEGSLQLRLHRVRKVQRTFMPATKLYT